jgi:hypothetical protein
MKQHSAVILTSLLFAIGGAGVAQDTASPPAANEQIAALKNLVATFPTRTRLKSSKEVYGDIVEVTFDVQKTDSLINPVIGVINFTEMFPFGDGFKHAFKWRLIFHCKKAIGNLRSSLTTKVLILLRTL